ncbi:hypothetical protein [Bdellovibrio sp. HCB2-146]|uniref:hypothetical protein n=1 Tax=Bdellovibrio sp. HCB2-146 TaxID=3394362 RepID=UPI0039BC9718
MNKRAILLLSLVGLSVSAHADQKATITCTGKNVVLTEKSPYLGEDTKFAQSLFVLKSTDAADESAYTAYFLDVDVEGDVDSNGQIWTVGKNSQGGNFTLKTNFWRDVGDGTIINQETEGTLTYSHGPLQGKNETVKCTKN